MIIFESLIFRKLILNLEVSKLKSNLESGQKVNKKTSKRARIATSTS